MYCFIDTTLIFPYIFISTSIFLFKKRTTFPYSFYLFYKQWVIKNVSICNRGQKEVAKMVKKGTFLSSFKLIIPPSPYINVELQVLHLTLTLNTDGGGEGDVICVIITNSCHYFCSSLYTKNCPIFFVAPLLTQILVQNF